MSEYAVGGPIPADAPLPQLDNSYILPAVAIEKLGTRNLLKLVNDGETPTEEF